MRVACSSSLPEYIQLLLLLRDVHPFITHSFILVCVCVCVRACVCGCLRGDTVYVCMYVCVCVCLVSSNLSLSPSLPRSFPRSAVDCELGPWQDWQSCSASCGIGRTYRQRGIAVHPAGSGKPCAEMTQEATCNPGSCESHVNSCFELNTLKTGNETGFVQAATPEKCQAACQEAHWDQGQSKVVCNSFSYDQFNHNCRMLSDLEESFSGPDYARFISGPRSCTDDGGDSDSPPDPNGPGSSNLPVGAIVGASLGGVAVLAAAGGGIAYAVKKKQQGAEEEEGEEVDGGGVEYGGRGGSAAEEDRQRDPSGSVVHGFPPFREESGE
eukprot:GHVU01207735.1.p1 GENE.GHVU01207735.1~~GHVU01207735.1.p1  ORF type:complete len:326 (-),score=56.58 GHVU01207735.1:88-1065(-)